MITEQQLILLTLIEHDHYVTVRYDVHIYLSYRRLYYHMLDIEKLNKIKEWFEENNKNKLIYKNSY